MREIGFGRPGTGAGRTAAGDPIGNNNALS